MTLQKGLCSQCGSGFQWSRQFYEAKGFETPPLVCPTCADKQAGKPEHQIVKEREALHVLEAVDVSHVIGRLKFERVEKHDEELLPVPYYRAIVKGKKYGASWSGRIDIFDQRTDHSKFVARVRVMRTRHAAGETQVGVHVTGPSYPWYSRTMYEWEHSSTWDYVVIEDTAEIEPVYKLMFLTAIQNRRIELGQAPIWSKTVHGSSRSGKHFGQATLALVEEAGKTNKPVSVTKKEI